MVGNRGIYHEGWTAVTRHGTPWLMVDAGDRPFEDDVWELYDTTTDWTQAHDLAAELPERLAELQELFATEAARHQVFPLDDRVTERENPAVAGRLDLHHGRTSITLGPRAGRLTEEAAPNIEEPLAPDHGPARRDRRGPTACWSRRAAGSAAGRCTASAAVRRTPTTATAAT